MHLAIFVWFNAPLGGLQSNVLETVRMLRTRQQEVTVICPHGPFARLVEAEGAAVMETDFEDIAPTLQFLQQRGVQLIHSHPGRARVWAQKAANALALPWLITYHGRWIDKVRSYWDQPRAILTVSPAIRENVLATVPEAAGRTMVLPNATRLNGLPRSLPGGPPGIVVASRFDADKHALLDFLAAAWEAQPSAFPALTWQVAGDGTEMAALTAAGRRLNRLMGTEAVTFHGWLPEPQLQALYRTAHFAVAPGRSAIDALGSGVPAVAVGSAGCFGLVTPETYLQAAHCNFGGYGLAEPQSATQVLAGLAAVWQAPDRLAGMGKALQDLVRAHHDQTRWDDALYEIYAAAAQPPAA